jgi:hypothetical protein
VSSPAVALPEKLVFSYQEQETSAYDRLVWARRDRGPEYLNFRAAMYAITFAIGFAVLFANQLGFVTSSELPQVLFTAYAAFFAGGFTHRAAMQIRYRAITRAMFRDIAADTFEVIFDAGEVAYSNARYQVQVPWAAVAEVIETSLIVVLMFERSRGLPIPARLFPDPAARANFVAAIRQHASGAKGQKLACQS